MEGTVTHKNVWCALAAAQAEFSAPKKDAINPAFRSKYADLSSVVEAVAPALSKHGIAFFHHVVPYGEGDAMRTVLCHGESDTQISCDVPLILGKRDMQGFKSATTYAKRIGLESVTGVAPDDDDGNDAAKNAPRGRPESRAAEPPKPDPGPLGDGFTPPDEPGLTQGVKGVTAPAGASEAEKARAYADGIIRQFSEAKTAKGLNGAWERNEKVIGRLQDRYPVEYGDVMDAFNARLRQVELAGAA